MSDDKTEAEIIAENMWEKAFNPLIKKTKRESHPVFFRNGEPRDYLCFTGANELMVRLTEYWHKRGYKHAAFWLDKLPTAITNKRQTYAIKSNLVNGLPPKERR